MMEPTERMPRPVPPPLRDVPEYPYLDPEEDTW